MLSWSGIPSLLSQTALPVLRHVNMTTETFTSFLFSTNNSALTDNHAKITQVRHQLVGDIAIERYIYAVLRSYYSVERMSFFLSFVVRLLNPRFSYSRHL